MLQVVQYAKSQWCRAVYLHVAAYNTAAMALYARNGFAEVAKLPQFYSIKRDTSLTSHHLIKRGLLRDCNSAGH